MHMLIIQFPVCAYDATSYKKEDEAILPAQADKISSGYSQLLTDLQKGKDVLTHWKSVKNWHL